MHMIHVQLIWLLQLVITSLFAALIAVGGTSHNNGPLGHGKTSCDDDEDVLINSAES